MHVGDDVIDLLIREHLPQRGHVAAAIDDESSQPLVVRRSSARQVLLLHHAFQSRPVHDLRRVGTMTPRTRPLEQT